VRLSQRNVVELVNTLQQLELLESVRLSQRNVVELVNTLQQLELLESDLLHTVSCKEL